MVQKIGFGEDVQCQITGLKGKAIAYAVHKNGCNKYFIQPPAKDDKIPSGLWVEEVLIDTIGTPRVKVTKQPKPQFKFDTMVRDQDSGFQGKVTVYAFQMVGTIRYIVQPQVDEKGKYRDGMWFDEQALEVVSVPTKKDKERQEEIAKKKPGGQPSFLR